MINMNRKKHRSFSFDDVNFFATRPRPASATGRVCQVSCRDRAHRAITDRGPRSGRYELIDFTNRVRAQISELKAFEEFDNALAHERSRRDHVSARVLRNSRVGKEIHKCA